MVAPDVSLGFRRLVQLATPPSFGSTIRRILARRRPPYLLMDLVRGETLEEFASRGGVSTTIVRGCCWM